MENIELQSQHVLLVESIEEKILNNKQSIVARVDDLYSDEFLQRRISLNAMITVSISNLVETEVSFTQEEYQFIHRDFAFTLILERKKIRDMIDDIQTLIRI